MIRSQECSDTKVLEFFLGILDSDTNSKVEEHMKNCSRCTKILKVYETAKKISEMDLGEDQ